MASRRFTAGYTPPALALVGVLTLLSWLAPHPGFYADKLILVLAAAALIALLWRINQRTARLLTRFLAALEQGDLAQSFRVRGQGAALDELGAALDRALARLRGERMAAAADNRFAAALVDETPTPLLAIDADGLVHLANKAARRLFDEEGARATGAFARYGAEFAAALSTIAPGRRQMCRVLWNGQRQRTVLAAAAVDRQGRPWRIVSVAIIQNELEAVELETQSDLVRVLTHEIMNSLTPVTSLAQSAARLVAEAETGDPEAIAEARVAIDALARRAAGITHFVDTYRDFGRTPRLAVARFAARPWIDELVRSFQAMPQGRGVATTVAIASEEMRIVADPELLGQVVLNLLKNAGEAAGLRDEPAVSATIARTGERVTIVVADNGPGVAAGLEEEIFLPFFTTRANGTGVGLSFAKQVVLLHGGTIAVGSDPDGGGATFRIEL